MPELSVTGTDGTSLFSIATSGGDGRTGLAGVSLTGPLASFEIGTTDPTAFINLGGAIQKIVPGNVRDTVLTAAASGRATWASCASAARCWPLPCMSASIGPMACTTTATTG